MTFFPREALENRRDVNPVAFSKKALAPFHSNLKEKIFHAMAVEPTTKYQKKEINEVDFLMFDWSTNPTHTV